MHRLLYIMLASVLITWLIIPAVWGAESAQTLTNQAMDECQQGRRAKDAEIRKGHFERGRALAEKAIDIDNGLADAHFALFCNIGERMRANGEVLFSVFEYGRLMEALDRTLLLNPQHTDALSSKGTILVEVPRLLGGDPEKGEAMLRQVIERYPDSINARMVVARTCADRGEHQEAFNLAKKALELAKAKNRQDLLPEAQKTFSEIKTKFVSN